MKYEHKKAFDLSAFRIYPLGGMEEIGRNMTVFEYKRRKLIVDIGRAFPDRTRYDADFVLPDFRALLNEIGTVDGIFITHAHEDHIGGVPRFLEAKPNIPVYGSKLTLEFLRPRVKSGGKNYKFIEVKGREIVQIGEHFSCEFAQVDHSIPGALAALITTEAGNALATGDINLDTKPAFGDITDMQSLGKMGFSGVDVLLVDSTNADLPGFSSNERSIEKSFSEIIAQTKGKVIIGSFASQINRVQQAIEAAKKCGRKVHFVGGSMVKNMRIAEETGYLDNKDIVVEDVTKYHDNQLVFVCTGTQGEPAAVLNKIATDTHPLLELNCDDTVIFSSSRIPGNEVQIFKIIDDLLAKGAKVIYSELADVHRSGHCKAGELLYLYSIIKPTNVIPIHGQLHHRVANKELAISTGIPAENVFLGNNGAVWQLKNHKLTLLDEMTNEYISEVDGRLEVLVPIETNYTRDVKRTKTVSGQSNTNNSSNKNKQNSNKKSKRKPKLISSKKSRE